MAAHTNLAATERIVVNWLNGEDIETSGIDFKAEYRFDGIMDGSVSVGIDGTYGLEYERDPQLDISGDIQLAAGGDLMGFLNYNRACVHVQARAESCCAPYRTKMMCIMPAS